MPDENGFYTIDDMELTREQMLEYFGLMPSRQGRPDRKWPDGIDSTSMLLIDIHTYTIFSMV